MREGSRPASANLSDRISYLVGLTRVSTSTSRDDEQVVTAGSTGEGCDQIECVTAGEVQVVDEQDQGPSWFGQGLKETAHRLLHAQRRRVRRRDLHLE